jgi:hypothetical protein
VQGRKNSGQRSEPIHCETLEQPVIERSQVRVQGIDEQTERKLTLELSGPTLDRQTTPVHGGAGNLLQQPCLADSGFSGDYHKARFAFARAIQQLLELRELIVSADQDIVSTVENASHGHKRYLDGRCGTAESTQGGQRVLHAAPLRASEVRAAT